MDRTAAVAFVLLGMMILGCERDRNAAATASAPAVNPQVVASDAAPPAASAEPSAKSLTSSIIEGRGPGFPESGPWVSFYGSAAQMGDLAKVAAKFRIMNIDADPGSHNFTDGQLKTLKAGGKNRVISYLNVGACENTRTYWSRAPQGFVPCGKNAAAHLGPYEGYPDETWMNPSDADYQKLVVEHVAARLHARGVDGFYLDNLELLSHGTTTTNGPCNSACVQGGLDLVRKLRERYPDALIVMQNGTGPVTRSAVTGGIPYPALLDGIAHEEVYAPKRDPEAEAELLAWKALPFRSRNGHSLWIAVEDYVGSCNNARAAREAMSRAAAHGFSSYVSDESGGQHVVCWW